MLLTDNNQNIGFEGTTFKQLSLGALSTQLLNRDSSRNWGYLA